MNRSEFLQALAEKLQCVTPEERAEALQYYNEYLDEAGPDDEERVIAELGSPERVANIIRANTPGAVFNSAAPKAPQPPKYDFPPSATQAASASPTYSQTAPAYQAAPQGQTKPQYTWLGILLLVLLAPIWGSIVIAIVSLLVGLAAAIIGVLFGGVASIAAAIFGIVTVGSSFALGMGSGLVSLGTCLLALALGLWMTCGMTLALIRFIPWGIRKCVACVQWFVRKVAKNG